MLRHAAFVLVLSTTVGLAISCGGGSGTSGTTSPQATETIASGSPPTPSPLATATPAAESGREPIYWRTADGFQSLKAGQPYKVLFRITNGYAEPTLRVTATCQSCHLVQPLALEAQRVEPVGGDAPGSYYPLSINLPSAGRWEIDVVAGSDNATILVDAQIGQSSG